jgi:uncharacterized membrane protein YqjE
MEATGSFSQLSKSWKLFARRLLTVAENRLELFAVEAHEGRERLLQAFLLGLGVAVLGLMATITLTASIVVLLWTWSPLATLLTLTCLYAAGAIFLCLRLTGLLRNWQAFPASLDQFRKDRECLEKILD